MSEADRDGARSARVVGHDIEVAGELFEGLLGAQPFEAVPMVEVAGRLGAGTGQLGNLPEGSSIHRPKLPVHTSDGKAPPRHCDDCDFSTIDAYVIHCAECQGSVG